MPTPAENALAIADLLDADDSTWATARYNGEEFPWYGRFLTQIVLLVGEAPIEYLSSRFGLIDVFDVVVAIFTRDLMVVGNVSGTRAELTVDVTAYKRSSITSVQVEGGESVFSNDVNASWPGAVSVNVMHGQAASLGLPLGHRTRRGGEALAAFMPSLMGDLGR